MTSTTARADRAARQAWPPPWLRRAATSLGPAVAILIVQQVVFPTPAGVFVRGVIVGALTALIALGMALIYRSNRILNFAQADLGGVSAVLVVMLMSAWGWPYLVALPIGAVAALAVGGLVELAVIRRFFRAPRLILTVATIGLSQLLAAFAVLLPRLWTDDPNLPGIKPPFKASFTISGTIFDANSIIAIVMAPICIAGLAWFLQRTDVGVAIRASAGSADRAGLLGIPVKRLQTLVWAIAGLLAFTATFLRAGILGLPVGPALSLGILLRSLAALMMGRLTNLTAITTSAVALGVLELGVGWNASSPLLIDPILALVVGIALIVQRKSVSRADTSEASTWQTAEEVRPIPHELARVREVQLVRWGLGALLVIFAIALPNFLSVDRSLKASAVIIYGILALSLVVLTGWAGQVSLGQVAFFAIGAVVGAKASIVWNADLTVCLLLSAFVGGVAAVIVGLPALRRQGLYLAVITFAFALATTSWLLNRRFFSWIPDDRVERHPLFGRIDIDSATRMYYVCLVCLVIVIVALRGVRHSRTGRVLIALRENERAAEAYGISATRAKLSAFAMSGAVAAFAGCLFVHHQQAFGSGPYDPGQNFSVFTMAVIGGIGSIPGALLGALYVQGSHWFLPSDWQFLASGFGVLLVLMIIPSGLGGLLHRLRDLWLRSVGTRKGLIVPSLLADKAEPPSAPPPPMQGVDHVSDDPETPAPTGPPAPAEVLVTAPLIDQADGDDPERLPIVTGPGE